MSDARDSLDEFGLADATIQELEAAGQGGTQLTRDLNDQLQEARIAAGLVAMSGPGVVIRLKDSSLPVPPEANSRDYLVSGQDVLAVVPVAGSS